MKESVGADVMTAHDPEGAASQVRLWIIKESVPADVITAHDPEGVASQVRKLLILF